MPWSFGNSVFQISLVIIQIKVCPTVTLAPLDKFFSSIDYMYRTCFLISIHTLLHNRNYRVFTYCICTNIYTMQVPAISGYKETVVVTLPYRRFELHIPLFLLQRLFFQSKPLILPCRNFDFLTCIRSHIKYIQMLLRSFHFPWHLIFVGFKCRTRFSY